MKITIGADPEVFIKDANGHIIPACGLIGGTKALPEPQEYGIYLQEDNVTAEFNIPLCFNDRFEDFNTSIRRGLTYITKKLPEGFSIAKGVNCVLFTDSQIEEAGPQAITFGCSEDYDAYKGAPSVNLGIDHRVLKWGRHNRRFAGGHVHIGTAPQLEYVPPWVYAQFADLFLGLPSVGYDNQNDGIYPTGEWVKPNNVGRCGRRLVNGQAGTYRPKTYGIEYRTLSNFWLWDNDCRRRVVANAYRMARFLTQYTEDELKQKHSRIPWMQVREAIQMDDRALAQKLLIAVDTRLNIRVPHRRI